MSNEEDDTRRVWPGTTCASWSWVFATEYAQFEARKAIANLSQIWMPPQVAQDQNVNDVLRVVKAAGEVQKAVGEALSTAVAEAIARGATWRQVGDQLGIGKTGAHNKFAKGLTTDQISLLGDESEAVDLCDVCWSGDGFEELLGFDDEEWEAAPPYVAVQHVWRRTVGAAILLGQAIFEMSELEDNDWATTFYRASEKLRGAVRVILTPKYPQVIRECANKLPISGVGDFQDSIVTALTQFGIRAVSASIRMNRSVLRDDEPGPRDLVRDLLLAHYDLEQAAYCLAQPATLEMMKLIERELYEQGDSVLSAENVSENRDLVKFYEVYRSGDLKALSEHVGEEIVRGPGLTLDGIREILADGDDV
ncbi:hypothetical protein ABZS96_15570 [Streptomyces avermitilis]|uniref:hypothetical protein n=1 Tax=Streptomyces avermitilis TaxID=33903 RepID=UPI0033B147A4